MKESKKIGLYLFLYTRGELSPAEQEELFVWRNQDPENEKLFFQMTDPDSLRKEMQDYYSERDRDFEKLKERLPFLSGTRLSGSMSNDPYDSETQLLEDEDEAVFTEDEYASSGLSPVKYWGSMISDTDSEEIIKSTDSPKGKVVSLEPASPPRKLTIKGWVHTLLAAAACAVIIIFKIEQHLPKSNEDRFQASMISSDGLVRALLDLGRGFSAGLAGITIHSTKNGEPLYIAPNERSASESKFYMLNTPADGEFILQLPDSTMVWLNGSSSIKYPANFDQHNIAIEVTGEVYIERSKDTSHRFQIIGLAQNAQRLTFKAEALSRLDINGYPDNGGILMTLISGVADKNDGTAEKDFHFTSGQQSLVVDNKIVSTLNVNANEVTAWRNGIFYYKHTSIQNIMPAIANWYEMEVQYPFGYPDKKFNLRVDRSASINDILDNLKSQGLRVTNMGKNITIWK